MAIQFNADGTLTAASKKILKEIFQATELSKFIRFNVGGYPNPLNPDKPWPWPIGPWAGDPDPAPNISNQLSNQLLGEFIFQSIKNAKGSADSFSIFDSIKREGIAQEALKELSADLFKVQKSISLRMEELEKM